MEGVLSHQATKSDSSVFWNIEGVVTPGLDTKFPAKNLAENSLKSSKNLN